MLSIINNRVEEVICQTWTADCIIMDPPDNLGLEYDGYVDKRSDYYDWVTWIIGMAMDKAPVVWVSYYHAHDFEIKNMLMRKFGSSEKVLRTFIWTFTFGQNRDSDCGSGYRPILRISRPGFQWDCEAIKVPSWRSEHGDKRASPGGRVPLDVWDFPRVNGNSPERRAWHPTQHPEALYIRMMKMSGCLKPGAWRVVDLFGGTGTALRAAAALRVKNAGINACVIEQSAEYCRKMAEDNHDFKIIDSL